MITIQELYCVIVSTFVLKAVRHGSNNTQNTWIIRTKNWTQGLPSPNEYMAS